MELKELSSPLKPFVRLLLATAACVNRVFVETILVSCVNTIVENFLSSFGINAEVRVSMSFGSIAKS